MRESRQRLEAVAPLLPASMHPMVSAGPIDAQGWTLLAENGAVAAKLRHMVPALEARLQSLGWPALPLRVRVLAAQ